MRLSRLPILVRSTAAVIVAVFGLQDMASAALAAGLGSPTPSAPRAAAPPVELPASVAMLEDFHIAGPDAPLVILIQDAHTNPSAQLNIARALERLNADRKIDLGTVYLEGGKGDLSLKGLHAASASDRRSVGLRYLKKGLLQGAEYFDLMAEGDTTLWGVENRALYERSLRVYRSLVASRAGASAALAKITRAYEQVRDARYGPSLAAWDLAVRRYAAREIDISAYAREMEKRLLSSGIDPKIHPNLKTLTKVAKNESDLDGERARRGMRAVARAALDSGGLRDEADRLLVEEFLKSGTEPGNEEAADTMCDLLLAAAEGQASDDDTAEAVRYLRHRAAVRALVTPRLFEEMRAAEERIYAALARTDEERRLVESGRMIEAWRAAVTLKLDPETYGRLSGAPARLTYEGLTGYLNRQIGELDRYYGSAIIRDRAFESALAHARTFYELAERRDRFFWGLMRRRMEERGERAAALVTGGYHGPNLKGIFREGGVSYVSFIPRVTHETDSDRYEKILLSRVRGSVRQERGTARPDSAPSAAPAGPDVRTVISTLQVRASGSGDTGARLAKELGVPFDAAAVVRKPAPGESESKAAAARMAYEDMSSDQLVIEVDRFISRHSGKPGFDWYEDRIRGIIDSHLDHVRLRRNWGYVDADITTKIVERNRLIGLLRSWEERSVAAPSVPAASAQNAPERIDREAERVSREAYQTLREVRSLREDLELIDLFINPNGVHGPRSWLPSVAGMILENAQEHLESEHEAVREAGRSLSEAIRMWEALQERGDDPDMDYGAELARIRQALMDASERIFTALSGARMALDGEGEALDRPTARMAGVPAAGEADFAFKVHPDHVLSIEEAVASIDRTVRLAAGIESDPSAFHRFKVRSGLEEQYRTIQDSLRLRVEWVSPDLTGKHAVLSRARDRMVRERDRIERSLESSSDDARRDEALKELAGINARLTVLQLTIAGMFLNPRPDHGIRGIHRPEIAWRGFIQSMRGAATSLTKLQIRRVETEGSGPLAPDTADDEVPAPAAQEDPSDPFPRTVSGVRDHQRQWIRLGATLDRYTRAIGAEGSDAARAVVRRIAEQIRQSASSAAPEDRNILVQIADLAKDPSPSVERLSDLTGRLSPGALDRRYRVRIDRTYRDRAAFERGVTRRIPGSIRSEVQRLKGWGLLVRALRTMLLAGGTLNTHEKNYVLKSLQAVQEWGERGNVPERRSAAQAASEALRSIGSDPASFGSDKTLLALETALAFVHERLESQSHIREFADRRADQVKQEQADGARMAASDPGSLSELDDYQFLSLFRGQSNHALMLWSIPMTYGLDDLEGLPDMDPSELIMRQSRLWIERTFGGKKVLVIGPEDNTFTGEHAKDNLVEAFGRIGVDARGVSPFVSDEMVASGRYIRNSADDLKDVPAGSYDVVVSVGGLYDPAYLDSLFPSEDRLRSFYAGSAAEAHRVLGKGGVYLIQVNGSEGNPGMYRTLEESRKFFVVDYGWFPRRQRPSERQTLHAWKMMKYEPSGARMSGARESLGEWEWEHGVTIVQKPALAGDGTVSALLDSPLAASGAPDDTVYLFHDGRIVLFRTRGGEALLPLSRKVYDAASPAPWLDVNAAERLRPMERASGAPAVAGPYLYSLTDDEWAHLNLLHGDYPFDTMWLIDPSALSKIGESNPEFLDPSLASILGTAADRAAFLQAQIEAAAPETILRQINTVESSGIPEIVRSIIRRNYPHYHQAALKLLAEDWSDSGNTSLLRLAAQMENKIYLYELLRQVMIAGAYGNRRIRFLPKAFREMVAIVAKDQALRPFFESPEEEMDDAGEDREPTTVSMIELWKDLVTAQTRFLNEAETGYLLDAGLELMSYAAEDVIDIYIDFCDPAKGAHISTVAIQLVSGLKQDSAPQLARRMRDAANRLDRLNLAFIWDAAGFQDAQGFAMLMDMANFGAPESDLIGGPDMAPDVELARMLSGQVPSAREYAASPLFVKKWTPARKAQVADRMRALREFKRSLSDSAQGDPDAMLKFVYHWGFDHTVRWAQSIREREVAVDPEVLQIMWSAPDKVHSQLRTTSYDLGKLHVFRVSAIPPTLEAILASGRIELLYDYSRLMATSPVQLTENQLKDVLRMIAAHPNELQPLMAYLIVGLRLLPGRISDTAFIEAGLSRILNSDLSRSYFLFRMLADSLHFMKGTKASAMRDPIAELDKRNNGTGEAGQIDVVRSPRRNLLYRYLRLEVHRESGESLASLFEAVFEIIEKGLKDDAASRLLNNEQIIPMTREDRGLVLDTNRGNFDPLRRMGPILEYVIRRYNQDRPAAEAARQITDIPSGEIDRLIASVPLIGSAALATGSAFSPDLVMDFRDLWKTYAAIRERYVVDQTTAAAMIRHAVERGDRWNLKPMLDAQEAGDPLAALSALAESRRRIQRYLAEKIPDERFEEQIEAAQSLWIKRHISKTDFGFSSNGYFPEYDEPKLEAFILDMRLSFYGQTLLRRIGLSVGDLAAAMAEADPGKPEQVTAVYDRIQAILITMIDYMFTNGVGSSRLRAIRELALNRNLNPYVLYDLFAQFQDEYLTLLDYLNQEIGTKAGEAARNIPSIHLAPAYRDLKPDAIEERLKAEVLADQPGLTTAYELAVSLADLCEKLGHPNAINPATQTDPIATGPMPFGTGVDPNLAMTGDAMDLGLKGYNLVLMAREGHPVPPGFVMPAGLYRQLKGLTPEQRRARIRSRALSAVLDLERRTGKIFPLYFPSLSEDEQKLVLAARGSDMTDWDRRPTLILSVRSGAYVSMPGMMSTVLEVAVNEGILQRLVQVDGYSEKFALRLYGGFLSSYGSEVLGIPIAHFIAVENQIKQNPLYKTGLKSPGFKDLPEAALRERVDRFKALIAASQSAPGTDPGTWTEPDPMDVLTDSVVGVYRSWDSEEAVIARNALKHSDDYGTGVTVQEMVHGDKNPGSAAAVVFVYPGRMEGLIKFESIGLALVSGTTQDAMDLGELRERDPALYEKLARTLGAASRNDGLFPQEYEVIVQDGEVRILQKRSVVIASVAPRRFLEDDRSLKDAGRALARGSGITGGAAVGRVIYADEVPYETLKRSVERSILEQQAEGVDEPGVILVMGVLAPEEAVKILLPGVTGFISNTVGSVAHIGLIARKRGLPAVASIRGLERSGSEWRIRENGYAPRPLKEGQDISIDAKSGYIYSGRVAMNPPSAKADAGARLAVSASSSGGLDGVARALAAGIGRDQPAALAFANALNPIEAAFEVRIGEVDWIELWRDDEGRLIAGTRGRYASVEEGRGRRELDGTDPADAADREERMRVQRIVMESFGRLLDPRSVPGTLDRGIVVLHLDGLAGDDALRSTRLESMAQAAARLAEGTDVAPQGSDEAVRIFSEAFEALGGRSGARLVRSTEGLEGLDRAVHLMSRSDRQRSAGLRTSQGTPIRALTFEDIQVSGDGGKAPVQLFGPGFAAAQSISRLARIASDDAGFIGIYEYLTPRLGEAAKSRGVKAFADFVATGDLTFLSDFSFPEIARMNVNDALRIFALGSRLARQSA